MSAVALDHQPMLAVAICDRRPFDRAALRALCSNDHHLRVVAEAPDGAGLLEQMPADTPLVVLLGRSAVREDAGLIGRVRAARPRARILVVAVGGDLTPGAARGLGADGFLPRDGDLADQLAAVYG
jgi:DNA-binding NarL/FixJ family response regulator